MVRRSPRRLILTASVVVAFTATAVLGACGSGGSDTEQDGANSRAVEQLVDYGLTSEQAECVVDEVGAETVVEATDLNALAESQQYQDAAEGCIDEG